MERARIILGCVLGERVKEIARRCQTRPNTVIKWRQRFSQQGLKGLEDAPRPGAKPALTLMVQPGEGGDPLGFEPALTAALAAAIVEKLTAPRAGAA